MLSSLVSALSLVRLSRIVDNLLGSCASPFNCPADCRASWVEGFCLDGLSCWFPAVFVVNPATHVDTLWTSALQGWVVAINVQILCLKSRLDAAKQFDTLWISAFLHVVG